MKFTNSPKLQNIFSIINIVEVYLNDKSSNILINFLSKGKINLNINDNKDNNDCCNQSTENKILQDKILKIKKIFEKISSDYFCLELTFANIFDKATQLFFFYSEYNNINDFAKEFYQFENFEKYENYIFHRKKRQEDIEKDYLKPIFTDSSRYKLFDNINYNLKIQK